ncbi:MAG: UDP-N-acetylmuramoyl-L-alanyl-D-glutamate--2,6-diaminopimelate ligase [Alphaproteobacteria bacterium]|nr:UDP-N-acetylmuramoyl-L-alanyl-D-glutamate--2,6-diaminopimelate ligase [Alphaproteobacteria bacterium]
MKLKNLLTVDAISDARFDALAVKGISADSRGTKPGDLFVAMAGAKDDGARFVGEALASGAVAVMAERVPPLPLPEGIAFIKVGNARLALALAAAKLFPRQPEVIAAVTGTSGKTSVAAFTRQIWAALGQKSASIGTVGLVSPTREIYGSLTTPDPVALHRSLDELAGEGVTHLAIEASSHGLDQHRLDGVRVAAGGFTNLSRDHLDYHPTLEAYLAAKLRLFTDLIAPRGAAVIAADHEHAAAVIAAARQRKLRLLTVGRGGEGIRLVAAAIEGFAQVLELNHGGNGYTVRLPLPGAFQVENALVAAGLAIATGSEPAAVFAGLARLEGAKGRLELVGESNGAPIFVDYAHKPDALAKALEALRPYATGRLIVVFGCGGDRDAGKRPMMGAIAAQMADRVIVTDDNPRSEDPAKIRAAILEAAPGAIEIGDRREAIRSSITQLRPGDMLLIAGKGHETGQIVGKQVLPFSDHEAVAAALEGGAA